MDFVDQKKIIREDFLLKREKLKENFTNENKNELILNLDKFLNNTKYFSIAGYYPIGSEIDCLEILENFQKKIQIRLLKLQKKRLITLKKQAKKKD